ncbi:hypothetical protein [Lacticaseibacillus sp. 866-1]|uniref:hypothetical protein n=1 Tax=Lacticaseibacillus sp. 866-1 TaxID=2799576 RepID=UPI00194508B5|nr:hypothetical protein [Lacticaseibacillus sp. 866-1]
MTDEDIQRAISTDDNQFKAKMKYARKDLTRRARHEAEVETEKAQRLSPSVNDGFIRLDPSQRSEDDLQQVIALLPSLFTNSQTRAWIASLLTKGKLQTMTDFGQDDKQFNSKLRKVVAYCHSHPTRTQGLMASRQDGRLQKELGILREFIIMIENGADDNELGKWVYDHKDTAVINELVDTPGIHYQVWVMNDFAHSGHDKYVLVNRAYKRQAELNKLLADR